MIGVSGSGKSSLVKAGLVPTLSEWPSAIVRLTDAGGDPFRALTIDGTVRLWHVFASGHALIEAARASLPRQLTATQRAKYHLPPRGA